MIKPNQFVCIYLQNPREKYWARLYEFDTRGVHFIGIEFKAFNDWCEQLGREEEQTIFPSTLFIPVWRLEKIVLDESQGVFKSFAHKFELIAGQGPEMQLPMSESEPAG